MPGRGEMSGGGDARSRSNTVEACLIQRQQQAAAALNNNNSAVVS